ncbi:MAG: hypothetical protein OJI67_09350, partial [Prosthecobacter sp.]|nr:hypothetical protein [Prosthecobacter sp.]
RQFYAERMAGYAGSLSKPGRRTIHTGRLLPIVNAASWDKAVLRKPMVNDAFRRTEKKWDRFIYSGLGEVAFYKQQLIHTSNA